MFCAFPASAFLVVMLMVCGLLGDLVGLLRLQRGLSRLGKLTGSRRYFKVTGHEE